MPSSKLRLCRKFRDFLRANGGNYSMLFGVLMFPIVGTTALAVDYTNFSRHRSTIQNSLDASALATAKYFATGANEDQLADYAQNFFEANLPAYINKEKVLFEFQIVSQERPDQDGGVYQEKSIAVSADLDYMTFIARVLGHKSLAADIASEVAMGNITVEIALVMDNSGSMAEKDKMGSARETSTQLVDSIFNGAGASNKLDPVKFALVPFAASVNVGKANKDANWIDKYGWAPIHHENLDWDTYVHPENIQDWQKLDKTTHYIYQEKIDGNWRWKTRFDIFAMLNVEWEGCVEMRPWPHNTLDTHQMTNSTFENVRNGHANGDGLNALFVPLFAPSEPYRYYAYRSYWGSTGHGSDSMNYANDYLYDWYRPSTSDPTMLKQIYYNTDFNTPYNYGVTGDPQQNLRQNWVWRYQAAAIENGIIDKDIDEDDTYGPNYLCTTQPIKPLTTSRNEIKNAINAMGANGNTNIHQGIAWGWRVLSSREPYTGGRDEADTGNRKYIIVLTDGNNVYGSSYTPNETNYGAWGYGKHGRMDKGLAYSDRPDLYKNASLNSAEKKMNVHTLQTCENARADGVTIFTIAFDVPDGSSVKEMMQACGGSGIVDGQQVAGNGIFYYDVGSDDLDDAMSAIAAQISDMRIIR
jgi:hypothetical protein